MQTQALGRYIFGRRTCSCLLPHVCTGWLQHAHDCTVTQRVRLGNVNGFGAWAACALRGPVEACWTKTIRSKCSKEVIVSRRIHHDFEYLTYGLIRILKTMLSNQIFEIIEYSHMPKKTLVEETLARPSLLEAWYAFYACCKSKQMVLASYRLWQLWHNRILVSGTLAPPVPSTVSFSHRELDRSFDGSPVWTWSLLMCSHHSEENHIASAASDSKLEHSVRTILAWLHPQKCVISHIFVIVIMMQSIPSASTKRRVTVSKQLQTANLCHMSIDHYIGFA